MRLLKQNPLLRLVNSYVVDSPQPANLSYMWNFGSLLATCLGLQIVTGVILAIHYTANIDLAFISVEHHLVLAESNAYISYSFKTISKPLNFNGLRDYFSALNMIWYSPCLLEIVG